MESALTWEFKTLINELTLGMEKATQLRLHLWSTCPSEAHDLLLQRILSSYKKALLILKWSGSVGQVAQVVAPTTAAPESSVSVDGSPRSEDTNKNCRNISKKRKLHPTWTEKVRVNSENGLEGPTDNGYSWRKYGQKDILGAKYPRSYYRCTYRNIQNCWATKQVQRSDDDPNVFEITYKGTHTCNQSTNAVPPPASPEKQEVKHNNSQYYQQEQQNQTLMNFKANLKVNTEDFDIKETANNFTFPSTFACHERENQYNPISSQQQNQTLMNFKANLKVNTEDFDIKETANNFTFPSTCACHERENQYNPISALADDDHHQGSYSSLFYSSATSESNYFSTATYQMRNYGDAPMQHSETDIADIYSAHALTTNSTIGGTEFSIDPVDLDPKFPFNIAGFFT